MQAKLLNGTEIREEILEEIRREVEAIKATHGVVPGLVTILVGANPPARRLPCCAEMWILSKPAKWPALSRPSRVASAR